MAYEMKEGTGSLFKNEHKESETQADYNGSILVAGVEYWINAWIKRPEGKKSFMSLSIKPKEKAPSPPVTKPANDGFDSDIPF